MNFEIRDDRDRLPDEEDIYGVNDAEERDAFNALFGLSTQERQVRRRRLIMRILAVVVVLAFGAVGVIAGLRTLLGW